MGTEAAIFFKIGTLEDIRIRWWQFVGTGQ
jgi:hypothetical protein